MQQAEEKLQELKEKGIHLADLAKEKGQGVLDDLNSGKLKEEAEAKLKELKDKGIHLSDEVKQKAEELWEDAKSGKLKEEAKQKLEELKGKPMNCGARSKARTSLLKMLDAKAPRGPFFICETCFLQTKCSKKLSRTIPPQAEGMIPATARNLNSGLAPEVSYL